MTTVMSASLTRTLMVALSRRLADTILPSPDIRCSPKSQAVNHHNVIDVSQFSDDVAVPSLGMRRKRCGPIALCSSNPSGLPAMPPIRS